jgi:hypothetical protein
MRPWLFYITIEQLESLRKLSARIGTSMAELVRRAIDKILKEYGE